MEMNNNEYILNMKKLDFHIESQEDSSVYLVNKLEDYIKENVSPYIIIALDKAKSFDADAVYFRFFEYDRPPLPQIYLYDNIKKQKEAEYYVKKHREIWSSCEIAVFFVIDKTTVRIYDSRTPVNIDNEGNLSSDTIDFINFLDDADNIIAKYRAQNFDNGSFWENATFEKHFLNSKVASERLINGLCEIRKKLRTDCQLSASLIDKLLIMCILIKYLEETGVDVDGKNYACSFFEKATGYTSLDTIIYNNKLHKLLSELSKHFNGGIFRIDDSFYQELIKTDISVLSEFFEAGYKNNLFGWKEYSFEHIPVELISNFYEEFIPKIGKNNKKDSGAVYTPSFLVNLLIDESLPLNELNENVKLIDPACGSGIFLVTAYKRLVQRWRIKNISENKLANTNPEILKNILAKNIFGVDINQTSINLSMFSLQLALCSMLTPKQIWTELQFSDLKGDKNLIQKDFFEYLVNDKIRCDFDLVIGNPPFKQSKLNGKTFNYYEDLLKEKFPVKFNNHQKEFAFLFLEKAMHLLKQNEGKLCLILPSGSLLYTDNSTKMRKSLFSAYCVTQIIDFIFLRRVLFEATVSSLAIFIEKKQATENKPIIHVTAKRTKQSKERFYFEFDHYDFYEVPQELVIDKINVWKCNLLGGYRVCDIIDKLNNIKPSFQDWCSSNNIKVLNKVRKDELFAGFEEIKQDQTLFPENELVPKKRLDCWAVKKKITKGKFPTEVLAEDFNNTSFDGILFKGKEKEMQLLKQFCKNYSDIISFYITATSGRQGIRSPYVFDLKDLLKVPYLSNRNSINEVDNIIISDIIKYSLDEFGNGENAFINKNIAKEKNLIDFLYVYSENLNKYYSSDSKQFKPANIIQGEAYYVCETKYTNEEIKVNIIQSEISLTNLLTEWNVSKNIKINKVMRCYDDYNKIIRIIKPKQLRFWIKSKALRDADETFNDILGH